MIMFDACQRAYAYSGLEGVIKAEMVNDVWSLGLLYNMTLTLTLIGLTNPPIGHPELIYLTSVTEI